MSAGRLHDKVALVTGGGSGIGRATALRFAEEGARVAVLDHDEESGAATVEAILEQLGSGLFIKADVSQRAAVRAAFKQAMDELGPLDALVNVVGVSGRRWGDGPLHTCTDEAWDRLMAINLKSMFLCCREALQGMFERQAGVILNVSSVLGLVGGDSDFATHAYAATKGGIISLTRALATYYAPHGIRANVLCPSLIATSMSRRAQASEAIRARLPDLHPLTGDFGRPEDVAYAAVYLASDEARFVTGVTFPIDGGWTAK